MAIATVVKLAAMAAPSELELSVVIPAYNEQARITLTLTRTLDYLAARHPSSEVLVVDDGSRDDTAAMVEEIAEREPRVALHRLPRNMGKGAAVRIGMLEARGKHVLFMDADLATPIEEVDKLLRYARQGADVVIGSRGLAESDIRARQPFPRELMGRTFNMIVRSLLLGGFKDTQCGFKLFTKNAARELFSRQTLDGFAFDVEVLLLAKELGYTIREVPVVWYHAPNSKVSPVTDSSRMFRDLVKLRARRLMGRRST
jgi:dolichyl-phosphate beta-glucosyltransferase